MSSLRTFLTTVEAVEQVHPHLRRITFAGGDLAGFESLGPDTFLYVLLPPPGRSRLTIDRSFTWEQYRAMPAADRPAGAYYTVRHWRPASTQLDMLFVLHGDEGNASAWAARAQPGDPVALWGPRTSYEPPPGTDWYLLIADDTGLPAAATIVESLPPGTRAHVFAEVDAPEARIELAAAAPAEVTWLYRRGAPPGSTTLLLDAVRALRRPQGRVYAWGAGESRTMTALRAYLRHEIGLAQDAVSMVAYWRRDASEPGADLDGGLADEAGSGAGRS